MTRAPYPDRQQVKPCGCNTAGMAVDDQVPVRLTGMPGHGRVVLASGSPRRLELLRSAGIEPVVVPSDIDEAPLEREGPVEHVMRLASAKALAAPAGEDDLVIAADTTVDLDGRILAKPVDVADARRMLTELSGRDHLVHTGVAVSRGGAQQVHAVSTTVRFAVLDDATIDWYLSTGESFDKAGGYALQGSGACLVESVTGSVSNVIGLPLVELLDML